MAPENAASLTEAEQATLLAILKHSTVDVDKVAEELGLNRMAANKRVSRLRAKINAPSTGPGTPPSNTKKRSQQSAAPEAGTENEDTPAPASKKQKKSGAPKKAKKETTIKKEGSEHDESENNTI